MPAGIRVREWVALFWGGILSAKSDQREDLGICLTRGTLGCSATVTRLFDLLFALGSGFLAGGGHLLLPTN